MVPYSHTPIPWRTRLTNVAILLGAVLLAAILIFGPALMLAGCAPALPVHYAGLAANRALPVLIRLEEQEGDVVIAEHAGDDIMTTAGLALVEARWAPFWRAWEAFITAQRAWADAFERHAPAAELAAAEKTAVAAFCVARAALPPDVPAELLTVAAVACP